MHELLHWASRARLPVIMANVNRAMAPGWNIWADQNDSLSQRDTGWMQVYCKNNQEVLDSIIMAYRISEKVLLPTMINLDAFVLSHTSEPVEIPDIELVKSFLPPYSPQVKLDIDAPCTFGTLTGPGLYTEFQYKLQKSMEDAVKEIKKACMDFKGLFGRGYGLVESYMTDDAENIIVTSSTMMETAAIAADILREAGEKVGVLRIRYLRPFPAEEVYRHIKGKERVIVLDRNISFGAQGIFRQELRAAVCGRKDVPDIYGYILGLGGRDVQPDTIIDIYGNTMDITENKKIMYWGDVKL
jgi:pyruvate/2-oxoacid:ferredoxin oxidoreductase alpha subunit